MKKLNKVKETHAKDLIDILIDVSELRTDVNNAEKKILKLYMKKTKGEKNAPHKRMKMKREIKFEYGFESINGTVKKVYDLWQIARIALICDLWNVLPLKYVRQFTGAVNKNGVEIYDGDFDADGNCVSWCQSCNGWEFSALNIPTNETCINCHRCDGNFFFEDHIDEFEVVGNKMD